MCCTGIVSAFYSPNMNPTSINTSTCGGVKISLLQTWLGRLRRVLELGYNDEINATEQEITDSINVLELWIVAKQADPETCEYFDKMQPIQTLVSSSIKAKLIL